MPDVDWSLLLLVVVETPVKGSRNHQAWSEGRQQFPRCIVDWLGGNEAYVGVWSALDRGLYGSCIHAHGRERRAALSRFTARRTPPFEAKASRSPSISVPAGEPNPALLGRQAGDSAAEEG